jgi:hypothetical protein
MRNATHKPCFWKAYLLPKVELPTLLKPIDIGEVMFNSIPRAAVYAVEWSFKVPHFEIFAAEGLSSLREECNQQYPPRFEP